MEFRFGELNVVCTDRERSLAFYRDIHGLGVDCEAGAGSGFFLIRDPDGLPIEIVAA